MLSSATSRTNPKLSKSTLLLLVLISIAIFACCKSNKNHYSIGDAFGTLLLSQALLEHGNIRLDPYAAQLPTGYQFHQRGGHYYYYFPLGTSIMVMPMAAMALASGKNMLDDNRRLQQKMAGVVNIAIFLLLFLIARSFVDEKTSLLLAAGFWFSTSLSSVLGTALWSHDFAILFALASLWLATRPKPTTFTTSAVIGLLLFLSYLCRPTLALLAPFLCLYFFATARLTHAVVICVAFGACMLIFMRFSWLEFGQLFPEYYMPQRLQAHDLGVALLGNMLSPSRGFLIYTPVLLALALKPAATLAAIKRHWVLWLAMLLWIITHWVSISRFPHWWGGYSYGPRLMVDVLPAVFLLLVSTVSCWQMQKRSSHFARYALAVILLAGSWMHTYQGLFNNYSGAMWNSAPNIDSNPALIFDWRYPQFLHNRERHEKRMQEAGLPVEPGA